MSYWDELYEEANYTLTLNGAKTHGSTGDACLDFFAVAGGMRYRSREEQIRLFDRAYIETPDLAMKLLFYLRDIRGGMGERKLFRTLIRHAALTWPESVIKNVPYIAEFGRWDDMLCLLDTPAQTQMVQVIQAAAGRRRGCAETPGVGRRGRAYLSFGKVDAFRQHIQSAHTQECAEADERAGDEQQRISPPSDRAPGAHRIDRMPADEEAAG